MAKKYTKEDWVQNREDVRSLADEVDKLTKRQEGWFKSILTSGDKYKDIVDTAKELSKVLADSTKRNKENNDLAENQSRVAKLGLSMGKRQTIFSKYILAYKLKQLKAARAQQDFEDDITDDMIDQIDAQREQVSLAVDLNKEMDALDDLFGGMGSTITAFLFNPLSAIIGILTMFSAMTDKIGEKFGALGVTNFRDDLAAANIEFTRMGLEGEEAFTAAKKLSSEFGVGFDNAIKMSGAVGDLAKSTGLAVEQSATLVGMFSDGTEQSTEMATNLLKSAASLAVAEGVAPNVVLQDIADSTETFAEFAKDGGKNLLRAAIQARKLGINLDTVAGTANSLLDFQSSLNSEVEASILLGRNVNLQKARELALSGDMEGLQKEIVNQVGSQAEFEAMNVIQRRALAQALGMSTFELSKIVKKEKEGVTLAGELAKQDLSNLIPEESMSNIAKTINELKAFGLTLIEEYGPQIEGMFERLVKPMIGMAKSAAEFLISLDESVGIGNVLKGVLIAMAAKAVIGAIAGIVQTFSLIPLGLGIPLAAVAIMELWSQINKAKTAVGDVISPADGKTQISTKEGELLELSKNDDVVAAPGIAEKLTKETFSPDFQTSKRTVSKIIDGLVSPLNLEGANNLLDNLNKPMMVGDVKSTGDLVYSRDEGGLDLSTDNEKFMSSIINVNNDNQTEISTLKLEKENKAIKGELQNLRKEMASYFGTGGSVIRGLGNSVGSKVGDQILRNNNMQRA